MFGNSKPRDNSKPEVSTGGTVRDDSASTSTFPASQNRFASSSEPAETMNPTAACESGSGKKGGLMHRLLAKVHKGEHHKSLGHSSHPQHEQQSQSEVLRKSPVNVRRVSIANESKENIPADTVNAQASSQPQLVQDRSILSSSLPATPAESVLPSFSRRSSVADDHHLQAFEASAPGRLALAIAPELREVKGLELLDALEEGALMRVRREHMGRSSTGMGKNAQVRCVAEGFQARLLFEGQGLTSLLKQAHLTDRDQGVHKAVIEHVEVMEGAWHRRKSIEVHTNQGLLSLLPSDAKTYATWVIGLNTALTAVELHRGDGIHPLRPARKLPLSQKLKIYDPSMAQVQEEPDA
ncbi:hypothetical protein ABBQ32_008578 [Trebouxia sp. C0010 RCD-2024]